MTIETENQKSVKGRIVAAAWQLFYEKGYNGTTVDDIIDLSGTSKSRLSGCSCKHGNKI